MKVLVTILSSLLLIASTFAAKSTAHSFNWIKGKDMKGLIVKARKRSKKRTIANDAINLSKMTNEYKEVQAGIFSANTPEKVEAMLNHLDQKYESLPYDAKFLAMQLLLLKPFRGITYRLIPIAEKERITHSFLRTQVKRIASNLNVHLPDIQHWEAGFKYITEPYKVNGKVVAQFKDTYKSFGRLNTSGTLDLQNFIEGPIQSEIAKAAQRLAAIESEMSDDDYIIWDNRNIFGEDAFQDDIDDIRYRIVSKAEVMLNRSAMHMGMHYINYFVSYDVRGLFALTKDLGQLYGIDGFVTRDPQGVSSKDLVDIMSKKKYKDIFTFKPGYEENMKLSYMHLREGMRLVRIAREEVRNKSVDRFLAIDPSKVNVFDTDIERQLKNVECLLEQQENDFAQTDKKVTEQTSNAYNCPIRSTVTGHTVVVDLKRYYYNPPKDLKIFLPIGHEGGERKLKKHGVEYPNYYKGRPNSWNLESYKNHIFPEIESQQDIPKYVRTLRHAYGGEVFGAPLAIFVE